MRSLSGALRVLGPCSMPAWAGFPGWTTPGTLPLPPLDPGTTSACPVLWPVSCPQSSGAPLPPAPSHCLGTTEKPCCSCHNGHLVLRTVFWALGQLLLGWTHMWFLSHPHQSGSQLSVVSPRRAVVGQGFGVWSSRPPFMPHAPHNCHLLLGLGLALENLKSSSGMFSRTKVKTQRITDLLVIAHSPHSSGSWA